MMKFHTLLLACTFSIVANLNTNAQNGLPQVPEDAFFVMRVSGSSLQNKMSLNELSELPLMKEMFKEFRQSDVQSLDDMGIDFSKDAYLFAEYTDSIAYMNWLMPLQDLSQFKATFFAEMGIEQSTEPPFYQNDALLDWNEAGFMFSGAFMIDQDLVDIRAAGVPNNTPQEEGIEYRMEETPAEYGIEREEHAVPAKEYEAPMDYNYEPDFNKYMNRYEVRDSLVNLWLNAHQKRMTASIGKGPVLHATRHLSVTNSKADASLYVDYGNGEGNGLVDMIMKENLREMARSGMQDLYGMQSYFSGMSGMMDKFSKMSITSDLNFGENQIEWSFDSNVSDELTDMMQDLGSQKMDKSFLNYMNSEDLLAYYTINFDIASYLKWYSSIFNSLEDTTLVGNSLAIIGEAVEILLDEEAVAEVWPGQAVLTISDLRMRKVTSREMKFDENFNTTWETVERDQPMPVFMLMMNTKRPAFIKRLLRLGVNASEGLMKETPFGFELTDSPLPFYIVNKGGMFFFGNDRAQLGQIKSGSYSKGLSSTHTKAILKNNSVLYFDGNELVNDVYETFPSSPPGEMASFLQGKVKDLMLTSSINKDGSSGAKMVITIPDGEKNGWSYMWGLFDEIYGFSTKN